MSEEIDPLSFQKKLEKAKTLDLSDAPVAEFKKGDDWIEPQRDVKIIELEKVKKRFKVQGYDLPEPEKPKKNAEKNALKRADRTGDYKRNRNNYRVMCPTCKGTGKCKVCGGRKRVKLFFKCKKCMGTGICTDCDRELKVKCPQCGNMISEYSDTCRKCGIQFQCPVCYSAIPAMATRCQSCGTEFNCKSCGKPYPRAYSWKCQHCKHWNEKL